VISGEVHLVSDLILSPLVVGRVLTIVLAHLIWDPAIRGKLELALVAITSWSRIARFSAHSPMNSSELSS
jgi:hypothetical protein